MRLTDKILCGIGVAVILGMLVIPGAMDGFIALTAACPFGMSFIKFAVLATLGECIALRITTGQYNRPGFGVLPKAVVWGFLGMGCKVAFTIFGGGTPKLLMEMGLLTAGATGFGAKLLVAFGHQRLPEHPVRATADDQSQAHGYSHHPEWRQPFEPRPQAGRGGLAARRGLEQHVGFCAQKDRALFWIPAHTITFMLPAHFQVLFAALLGVALGVILAFAGLRAQKTA